MRSEEAVQRLINGRVFLRLCELHFENGQFCIANDNDGAEWRQAWTMNRGICLFGARNGVIKEHLSENATQNDWTSSIAANSSAFGNTDLTITGHCCLGLASICYDTIWWIDCKERLVRSGLHAGHYKSTVVVWSTLCTCCHVSGMNLFILARQIFETATMWSPPTQ
jgi:hypothetical protein